MNELEKYFLPYRNNIIGADQSFEGPFGKKKILYFDWTASAKLYRPIEDKLVNDFGPFVANTHNETSITGTLMTMAYHEAKHIIKKHVNANEDDVLIAAGNGMTGVINKFQRMMGYRVPEKVRESYRLNEEERPVVFITHMEHHSNQTTWLETICDVVIIDPDEKGLVDLAAFEKLVQSYKNRLYKIASVSGGSNVTGIIPPYNRIAAIMHRNNGLCFIDFACSAPYIKIDMHPQNEAERLDAIFFSPHKFLGGPGTSGILIFNSKLYHNLVPDHPGGGTVKWTNPWNEYEYIDSIEEREDGGTPPFLQTIKAALCVKLKEEMGIDRILKREAEIMEYLFSRLSKIPNLHILAGNEKHRLGVFSFYIDDLHFNFGVKLLNDKFGIQVRGGCSCAGTYGHYLLNVDQALSKSITNEIHQGILSNKPGWIRISIHPTTSNADLKFVCDAVEEMCQKFEEWKNDYQYQLQSNEFTHKTFVDSNKEMVLKWFEL